MVIPSHPSNLELQALSVLWYDGPSTVSSIHANLPDGKERAYTTVLSVMQSLEKKGLVLRERAGRAHVYEPAFSKESIVRRVTDDFVTNAFGGRLGEAILATLSLGSLTPEEKTNIERELQRHKTMAAKKPAKKVAKKKAATPAKKTAKKAAKKAAVKKSVAKKATKKKAPAKKVAKKAAKKVAKKVTKKAAKKVTKKAAKKVAKKVTKKAAKKVTKKAAKKAAKKVTKKAAKKVTKKAAKKAAKKANK